MNFAEFLLSSGVDIVDGAFSANGINYFFNNNDNGPSSCAPGPMDVS